MIIYRVTIGLYVVSWLWFAIAAGECFSSGNHKFHNDWFAHRLYYPYSASVHDLDGPICQPDAAIGEASWSATVQSQKLTFGVALLAVIASHLTLAIVRRGYLGLPLHADS